MTNRNEAPGAVMPPLGPEPTTGRRRRWLIGSALLVIIVAGALVMTRTDEATAVQFKTQEVQRGDITVTVTATGNLEPTNQVDVSSELSGTVRSVAVDYNDLVKVGQVLAKLDTSRLEKQVQESKAAFQAAQAHLIEAQASVVEARSNLERLRRLRSKESNSFVSQQDLDAAQAVFARAQAGEASAKAQIAQADATLDGVQTDLAKTVIYSPINGIVLKRTVEPGQTVASSFQAPTLFTLAEDLTHMELHVDVDEADIGKVKEGQMATFTVDAYPDRRYEANVAQVRYGSETVGGVVTYKTVLRVDNSDLSLRPGMTATADIAVLEVKDTVMVPNAALRFTPPAAPEAAQSKRSFTSYLFPRPPRGTTKPRDNNTGKGGAQQRVWIVQGGGPVAVPVTTGATDGSVTQIVSGDLTSGTAVIVDTVYRAR